MLGGGLWHGASWTFVVWGGIHGGSWSESALGAPPGGPDRRVGWGDVPAIPDHVHISCLAWHFFRAQTFAEAFH